MSTLPPKADMARHDPDVRFVPEADIRARRPMSGLIRQGRFAADQHPGVV